MHRLVVLERQRGVLASPAHSLVSMKILVVIVNYGSAGLSVDCLASVLPEVRRDFADCEIGLCDNGSPDGSADELVAAIEREGWTDRVGFTPLADNRGFAGGNNAIIAPALGSDAPPDYVLLLNPDTVIGSDAIKALWGFMEEYPAVGICGSRLEYPDGSTQFAARRFPGALSEFEGQLRFGPVSRLLDRWRIVEPESDRPHPTDWLPGASLMVRREVFEQIGLLDDGYFMYYEEVDFCLRAKRAGWQVWYVPQSRVVHLVGQSSGVTSARPRRRPKYWYDSRRRYFEKNYGVARRMTADLAFATGLAGHRLRHACSRRHDPDPPHLLGDFIRYCLTGKLSS